VSDILSGADTPGPAPERPLSRLARAVFARHPQGVALTAQGRSGATLHVGSGGLSSVGALAPPQRKARRFGLAREDGDDARVGGNTNAEAGRRAQPDARRFGLAASTATYRQERSEALGGLGGTPPSSG
jgi:hypothetical protein